MSLLTIILVLTSGILSFPATLIMCKQQKIKKIYKAGHIPEFENPENEEADTYYGLNSMRLFPDREKGRVNKSAAEEEKKKEKGSSSKVFSATPELTTAGTQKSEKPDGVETPVKEKDFK